MGPAGVTWTRPGACRRYPELVQKETNDWCGEHKLETRP